MKKFFLSALVVGLSLASCTTVTKTASTLDVATGLKAQSTADLIVSSQKITYTHHTISAERKGGKQNVINAAIQAALAQNGNADVLVYNREVSGYGLENKELNCLAARVLDCEDNNFCIYLIEQWLLSQLRINSTSRREQDIDRIMTVIRQMYSNPNIRISELASIACLSKKQFERIFLAMVGMNPKEYARIVRFQQSLKLMQNQPESISLAQISYQCGYSDQSHFIREFRTLSGYTPLSLREICEPYSDLFTTPL